MGSDQEVLQNMMEGVIKQRASTRYLASFDIARLSLVDRPEHQRGPSALGAPMSTPSRRAT